MRTNNESSGGISATKTLYESVQDKFKNFNQENNSEDSSSSHSLSIPIPRIYKPFIYKVPEELRKLNESAYNPRVVSIGPIHNKIYDDDDKEEQNLKATEHIKVAYTKGLLLRIAGKSASKDEKAHRMGKALSDCSTAMLELEASALNCYAENLKPIIKKKIPEHRLAEMLLIDGCFILELLYRFPIEEKRKKEWME